MTYDLPLATLNKADFAGAVTACMDAGAFARTDPLTVSPEIWTAAHGIAPLLITKPSLPWGNKMAFATREGLLTAILLMLLPFTILWVLVKLLPPWPDARTISASGTAPAHGTS